MKTQLYDWHSKHGDIIDFSDFKMPVMYSSIKEEHLAVRNAVGLFDVSHMGRMWILGHESGKFLNLLVPRDLNKTLVGRASYTFMLNELGGFKDDLVFERLSENEWLLIWNAGNLNKIKLWLESTRNLLINFKDLDITLSDISSSSAMFALQGPNARSVLKAVEGNFDLPSSWNIIKTSIKGIEVIISATGYTGEIGYEIIIPNTTIEEPFKAVTIWEHLLKVGESYGIKPCGLGARDSLRLEAGLSLYGNDIDENINPIEADLFFPPFIHMDKSYFIGKTQLEQLQSIKLSRKRIGFIALKKGPSPRKGVKLFKGDEQIGITTSGGFSPLLDIGIGMGYLKPELAVNNTVIQYEIRGKLYDARISKFPLYDSKKYGGKRVI